MGQIVKRKKKGRPSKADLARRAAEESPAAAARRRSLRRRNVRHGSFVDYDDYLDGFEDFEEEEEDVRRREKKMKLLLKLNSQNNHPNRDLTEHEYHAPLDGAAASSSDEESERKPSKKRRVNDGGDESEPQDEGENDQQERERKAENKEQESAPGTPTDHVNGLPLPEKEMLELILYKLQKKDTYGVYAEPVDLEELPDYLDVIDHPMDFATVRKKLGNGSYSTLEQFESDVFLICSNAMQYNAPDTIYHKQARAIQELAKKKFEKLRTCIERSEKELKSEQKTGSSFMAKKQMKKPFSRTMQEPLGSDFSSGATLATAVEVQNGIQSGGCEKPSSNTDGPVEGNFSLSDYNVEKADLSSGKGLLSKFGKKPSVFDENRRATYNMSNEPVVSSESIFTTFESEIKQLIPVGLDAQYFYARSLARFAATLGPVAWKVASNRIEQSVPPGCKFGRGWVGEYEPLPTPVLMLETRPHKEPLLFPRLQCTDARNDNATSRATDGQKGDITSRTIDVRRVDVTSRACDSQKGDVTSRAPVPAKELPTKGSTSEGNPPLFRPTREPILDGKSSLASTAVTKPITPMNSAHQQQNLPPRRFIESRNKALKQVELNLPPSSYQHDADVVTEKQLPNNTEISAAKPRELSRTVGTTHSIPSKLLEKNGVGSRGLPNGKVLNSSLNSRMISSSDSVPNHMGRAVSYHPQGLEHRLTDPVEAMKISAEKAHKSQKPLNESSADTPQVIPSVPSAGSAAVAAARAWMSVGAGGFRPPTEISTAPKNHISVDSVYNQTRQLHPQFTRVQGQFLIPAGIELQHDKSNFPFQAFMRPVHAGNEGQLQSRPMIFPQFLAADLSRFQMQSPWQGLNPHSQAKEKQETLPPDLNIGFQSPGSPAKQSSGVLVDSPQPDLALQL